jgi:hypothetical protein
MLAEAYNESGDGSSAEQMLNTLRYYRRGGASVDSTKILPHVTFASQTQMRTAIKNERRWEFALEGYRFYDLVRWGDASSVLGSLGYQDRCQYYPIPQKAIDLSGTKLVQNPLWK